MTLTIKQEKFCQSYVETGNASEAYRLAYNADKMKKETINRKAKDLLYNGKITARVDALKKKVEKRHNVTVDGLIAELDEIKKIALSQNNPHTSAAVTAVMGKARITGLDKQVVEQTNLNLNFNKPLSSLFEEKDSE